jgi:hypothetical protein
MQNVLPVKTADIAVDDFPLITALFPGLLTDLVAALLHQQCLVTADKINRKQLVLEMTGQFLGVETHY